VANAFGFRRKVDFEFGDDAVVKVVAKDADCVTLKWIAEQLGNGIMDVCCLPTYP
jgi:hypothetical protein